MGELPNWLQEIRARADAATKGPWRRDGNDLWHEGKGYNDPDDPHKILAVSVCHCDECRANMEFCAAARTDVPRLLGLAEEMAGALQALVDTNCEQIGCMRCGNSKCLSQLWGRAYKVLAKYRREVDKP